MIALLRTARWALPLALVAVAPWGSSAHASNRDHLQCHRVSAGTEVSATVDVGTLPFGLQAGCRVAGPVKEWCEPVAATVLSPETPGAPVGEDLHSERLCYRIRCAKNPFPVLQASDRFGTRTVTLARSKRICVAAVPAVVE